MRNNPKTKIGHPKIKAMQTVTPSEFEQHVRDALSTLGERIADVSITRLEHVNGAGGEYEIDVVARFTIFCEAEIYSDSLDRLPLISRLAIALSIGTLKAREIVDFNIPVAVSIRAQEVLALRSTLESKDISIRTEPIFLW